MENKREFITNTLYYALIIGLVYLFCNYLLGILSPFILGFLFAYIAVKISRKLFKSEKSIIRIISLTLLYVLIVSVIGVLLALGISKVVDFFATIPNLYRTYIEPLLKEFSGEITEGSSKLPPEVSEQIGEIVRNLLDSIKSIVSSLSSFIVSSGTSLISNTTGFVVALFTMLITSYFAVSDYENIISYLESLMPLKVKKVYDEVTDFLVNTVLLIVKSYGLILLITFVELLIGLAICGVDNFAMIAMITAFLDIMPVLGVGLVLIPWFIYEFIVGNYKLGIMLLILEVIITIIRNIIEPKIVGDNIGLHPLATLFLMLIGLELFGAIGMFGLPLVISFFIKRKEKHDKKNSQISEEELVKINGGQILTELPKSIDADAKIYIRLVMITDESGNPLPHEIVGSWVLYKGPETIGELIKGHTGQYRIDYVII